MKRDTVLDQIENTKEPWDFLVIGGGATGLGVAVDASARGYRTLLVEQHDFAKATSSRSTKLVHGGVRYLQQGNISLVLEALRERGLLCENAPHLVHHLEFIVPVYSWWEGPFYGVGMKIYDRLAGKLGLSPSRVLSREETLKQIPTLEPSGLQRGVSVKALMWCCRRRSCRATAPSWSRTPRTVECCSRYLGTTMWS